MDGLDVVRNVGMHPFGMAWRSFRKSFAAVAQQFVLGGIGQIALSLAVPIANRHRVATPQGALVATGVAGWLAHSAANHQAARLMRANPWLAPLAPLTGALFGGVLLDGARLALRGTAAWKGRPAHPPHNLR